MKFIFCSAEANRRVGTAAYMVDVQYLRVYWIVI